MQTRHVLPLIGLVLLAGCAGLRDSGPEPPEPQRDIVIQPIPEDDDDGISREESERLFNPDALGEYDVATIQAAEFTDGEELELSPFSRARMFAAVLETLELSETMSASQREKLYNSLFNGIPAQLLGTYRAIAIGRFFASGEPLYILLGVAEPTDRAPRGTERTFLLQTSALSDNNRVATYEFGRFVDLTVNVSFVYHIRTEGPDAEGLNAEGRVREGEAFTVPSRSSPFPGDNEREDGEQDDDGDPGDENGVAVDDDGVAVDDNGVAVDENGVALDDNGDPGDENGIPLDDNVDPRDEVDPEEASEFAGIDELPATDDDFMPELLIPAERIRLARRIVETSFFSRTRQVPGLIDPLIEDTRLPLRLRAEAVYTRFLYNLFAGQQGEAEETAEMLYELVQESNESESASIGERLAYRVEHIIPIMLETYEYDRRDSETFNQSPEVEGEGNGG